MGLRQVFQRLFSKEPSLSSQVVPRAYGLSVEEQAVRFLRNKGYRVLERNLRFPIGELDIVADHKGVLVFVEVKGRRTSDLGGVSHAVDARKQEKLIRLAALYLSQHRIQDRACRFDVVLCQGRGDEPGTVEHIEHAFDVPGDDFRC